MIQIGTEHKNRIWIKVVSIIFCALFSLGFVVTAMGVTYLQSNNVYLSSKSQIIDSKAKSAMLLAGENIGDAYFRDKNYLEVHIDEDYPNLYYYITIEDKYIMGNGILTNNGLRIEYYYHENPGGYPMSIVVFPRTDDLRSVLEKSTLDKIDLSFKYRYPLIFILIAFFLLAIIPYVANILAKKHSKGKNGILLNPFDKLSIDFLFCALAWAIIYIPPSYYSEIKIAIVSGFLAALFLSIFMLFIKRIIIGRMWQTTMLYYALTGLKRFYRLLNNGIKSGSAKSPFVIRTAAISITIAVLEQVWMNNYFEGYSNIYPHLFLFVINSVLVIASISMAINIKNLQIASKEISIGNLNYIINTSDMTGELKLHGENLNNINHGMIVAVDEKIKSERLKTELITNVSHDIKTPLTSIINYVDLIQKEKTDNVNINEYATVLARQSDKLKRLIIDLVDASKFSTGNVELNLAPCDIGVLMEQIVGEYQDKLADKGFELIANKPEEQVNVMADGRHLWRVVDNLMSNIIKYSQEGSRVYLNIESLDNAVLMTLKNVSKYPLNISPDELMDRFVRGDQSRSAEGNGLGLSIAKSLIEAQSGKLSITIDGDLFKIMIKFQKIENEKALDLRM